MTAYHKLVRDKIPAIIESQGKKARIRILDEAEYGCALEEKLHEEVAEFQKDQNLEELADLLEVIFAAAEARGYTKEQLESVRSEKEAQRGVFRKRLLLLEVSDS